MRTETAPPRAVESAHLIGICGSGMKSLAQALLALGVRVSGSDNDGDKADGLRAKGATVYTGHDGRHVSQVDVVVYSTAIPDSNPEMVAARGAGIPLWHRSRMLGWLLSQFESILIAGTHGKTTTTTLSALLLTAGGFDPWAFVGGTVAEFGGNVRIGGPRLAVAEADESDGSFLDLPRQHAIVTNIEDEHLNYWETSERMFEGFRAFAEGITPGGILMCSADDPGVARFIPSLSRRAVLYTTKGHPDAEWSATNIELFGSSSRFTLCRSGVPLGVIEIGVPGLQNVSNATGAMALALMLGGDFARMSHALRDFHGVDRRFTKREAGNGVLIIDDYGHHPTEIRVTVEAARRLANERGGRLFTVLQPHRYSRTASFFQDFGPSLAGADEIILTEIYGAGENPLTNVNGRNLCELIRTQNTANIEFIPDFGEIKKSISARTKMGDIVLLLGAGSVTKLVNLLTAPAE